MTTQHTEPVLLHIRGMHCASCPRLIEQLMRQHAEALNISKAKADARANTLLVQTHAGQPDIEQLNHILEPHGFCAGFEPFARAPIVWNFKEWLQAAVLSLAAYGLYLLIPEVQFADEGRQGSLLVPLMVGFGASLSTCLALVGSVVVAFTHTHSSRQQNAGFGSAIGVSALFQTGRLCSFFICGGLLGFAGSRFALQGTTLGFAYWLVAAVLTVVGLHLAGFSQSLFAGIPWPRVPGLNALLASKQPYMPYFAGFFTFFLPCGFAVSMMLLAVQAQSFTFGGLIMLSFALGTLPVLFAIGLGASLCSSPKIGAFRGTVQKTLAIILLLFAWQNIQTGLLFMDFDGNVLARLGSVLGPRSAHAATPETTLEMQVGPGSIQPRVFRVKAGEKVEWRLKGGNVSYCTNAWIIPQLGIKQPLKSGETASVHFTVPDKPGTSLPFSCWMGMIRGVFVIE